MKKQITLALTLSVLGYGAMAQKAARIAPGALGMCPAAVEFLPGQLPDYVPGKVLLQRQGSFIQSPEAILKNSEADQIGQQHFRYQQKMNGVPVEGASYVVHVAGGKILRENGAWIADQPSSLPTVPAIGEAAALDIAMNAFGANSYKWQLPAEEAFIKRERGDDNATFKPQAELVYYSGENTVNADNLRLAYKLDLYAQEPVGRKLFFIDAINGTVLGKRELIHTNNATSTANTAYSGTQSIVSDQTSSSSYRLQENSRGNGIYTYNLGTGYTYSAASEFISNSVAWNPTNPAIDQYALDAHWGAEKTYDYYKNTFGRNSIDNAGLAIVSYVHYGSNYFNAFWDGSRMTYGDGGVVDGNKPLTAIDVCAHEITHGLTQHTAGLYYSGESGALNEGFSDIFGTTIEFYAKPATANWTLGEAFYTVRSMSDPNMYGQPDTYQGINWATGTADNGGVHTNSGVLNYWYYLLTNGGSGTNDNGTVYSVTGIGITKAAAITYRTLTIYMTPTAQYADACNHSVQAATDLYGASSNEVAQVVNAWKAVGLVPVAAVPYPSTTPMPTPTPAATNVCSDIYEPNENQGSAKTIATNANITAMISNGHDKDWFTFTTLATAPKVKITLTNLPANYDLKLYNVTGKELGNSHQNGTTMESISYNGSNVGATYYVQVFGANGSAFNSTTCYTLRAATSNVSQLVDEGYASGDDNFAAGSEKAEDGDLISVFPNPAKDNITLSFGVDQGGKQSLVITDLMGRVVLNTSVDVQAGINAIHLPLSNYHSGIYFLHLSGKDAVKFQITE